MKTETLTVISIQSNFDALSDRAKDFLYDSCDVHGNRETPYTLVHRETYIDYIESAITGIKNIPLINKELYLDVIDELNNLLNDILLCPPNSWVNVQK